MPRMEENLFPSALSLNSYKELEEERRLFYVAITRAEEHCYLSFAKSRFKYGKMEFSSPSRFLKDIDVHFLKLPQEEQMARRIDERASRFCREQMNVRLVPCLTNLLLSLLTGVLHRTSLVVRKHF